MSICSESHGAKKLTVDSTSLADLKAELYRKKGEAERNKQKGNYRPEKVRDTKTNIWSKENTGLIARMQKDIQQKKEDEFAEARAKHMLEKKAKLYDSLKKGKGRSTVGENYLVNFSTTGEEEDSEEETFTIDKEYPASSRDDEWVDYVDALGRTRKCMKRDLPGLKRQDKDMVREEDEDRPVETGQGLDVRTTGQGRDVLDQQTRYDLMRQKWEEQEVENLEKDQLHYSNIRYDEARTHGAGFYNFSNDEDARLGEQSTLKKLHEETDDKRRQRERKNEKRDQAMKVRLKKIRARKRKEQGLEPLESDSDSEEEKRRDGDSDDDGAEDIQKSVMEGLRIFRSKGDEEMERRKNEQRRVAGSHKRDWDQNKEEQEEQDKPRKEWRVMDQGEWNSKKREERPRDFAPPTSYGQSAFIEAKFAQEAKLELKRKEEAARNIEVKRKKFNANSWKDGIGGMQGPPAPRPQESCGGPPAGAQKFPMDMPPSFSGPPPNDFGGPSPRGFGGPQPQGSSGPPPQGFGGPPPQSFAGPPPQGFGGPPSRQGFGGMPPQRFCGPPPPGFGGPSPTDLMPPPMGPPASYSGPPASYSGPPATYGAPPESYSSSPSSSGGPPSSHGGPPSSHGCPPSSHGGPPPAGRGNWGVPGAGFGSGGPPLAAQGPRPSPLPQDSREPQARGPSEPQARGPMHEYNKVARLELHRRMQAQEFDSPPGPSSGLGGRIINELEGEEGESSEEEEEDGEGEAAKRAGRGAEVAPPTDMNYYGATQGKVDRRQGFRSHEDMADAFLAGLQAQTKK